MKAKREHADFDKVQAGLKARGFQEKDVTIPSGKAMVLGVVCALPFVIVFGRVVSPSFPGTSTFIRRQRAFLLRSVSRHHRCLRRDP